MATSALALLAAGALAVSAPNEAQAITCVQTGTIVECDLIDLDGFSTNQPVTQVNVTPNTLVRTFSGQALRFDDRSTTISSFTIGAGATVESFDSNAISISPDILYLRNDGTIRSSVTAVLFQNFSTGDTLIENNGSILSPGGFGTGISSTRNRGDTLRLINTGTISAPEFLGIAYLGGDQNDIIVNSGEIIGGQYGVFTDDGADQIINTGTIRIADADRDGAEDNAIDTGEGNDIVINDGIIRSLNAANGGEAVELGRGDDIFEVRPNSQIFSDNGTTPGVVNGAGGTDILRLGGTGSGAFNLDTLATQFRGFNRWQVFSGTWTTSGATDLPFSVESGATLTGTGTFGELTFNSGSTVAPGNSIGTLTVNGDVTFGAGSVYQAEVDVAGNSDLINATGAATIDTGAGLQVVAQSDAIPTTLPTYTILQAAGGVDGTFTTVTDNLPDLDFAVIYNANTVQLTYTVAGGGTSGGGAGGGAGGAGGGFGTNGGSGTNGGGFSEKQVHPSALGGALDAAGGFSDTMRRRASLHGLHGRGANGLTSQTLGFAERQPAADIPRYLLGADPAGLPPVSAPETRDWAIWGAVLGSNATVDDTATLGGWDASTMGLAFGLERQFAGDIFGLGLPVLFGIAGGYSASNVQAGTSAADIDGFHIGTYTTTEIGALSIATASSLGFQNYDLTRVIPVGAAAVTATGETDGYSLTSGIEAHYDLNHAFGVFTDTPDHPLADVRFGPLASVTTLHAEQDGFTETGAGILNLTVADTDVSQTVTGLGLAFGMTRATGATLVSFDGRISWEHVFGDRQVTTNSNLTALPGATFVTNSAPIDRNRLAVGFGAAVEFSDTISAHLRYDGRFSGGYTDHRGSAGLTIRF